jgi:diacylglycerol kinase (ATP)
VNVWILCNEDAGRSLSDKDLRELAANAGHTVVDLVSPKKAQTRPPDHGVDLIVAAGGDGTVATAASLAATTSTPFAILPLGTANNIATSLGIDRGVPELISSWHRAGRVPFDLGHARAGSKEWLVVEGLGGGLIPAGIAAAQRALESVEAPPSVELVAAVQLFYNVLTELEPVRRTITVDGRQLSEELLMFEVLNIRSVGPNLVLAPDATPSDGLFDVILAGPAHRTDLLEYLESRIHNNDRRLSLPSYRARHVHIDSCEDLHIDDERIDTCSSEGIDISVAPGAATLLM